MKRQRTYVDKSFRMIKEHTVHQNYAANLNEYLRLVAKSSFLRFSFYHAPPCHFFKIKHVVIEAYQ